MTPERWRQTNSLLQEAMDRPPEEREAFLDEVCAGDHNLRKEVDSLLSFHERATVFLETPALEAASGLLADDPAGPLEGQVIGFYKIERLVGTGGMGEVYLAEDTRLDRKVAIKFLPGDLEADELARKRQIREAKAAAKLDHPNICTIHEVAEHGIRSFIVMQYVEGETLASRMASRPMQLGESLDVAIQVADALSLAHSRGVIHRDIKPQNVMITPQGQVKVLDFGLAKVLRRDGVEADSTSVEKSLSAPGLILGTAPYMSPEQAKGAVVDGRSDLFSLGVVLYECVTGKAAFGGDTPMEVCAQVIHVDPPSPSQVNGHVRPDLDAVILRTLAKDPDARYQSAGELLEGLRSLRASVQDEDNIPASPSPLKQHIFQRVLTVLSEIPGRTRGYIGAILLLALVSAALLWLAKPVPMTIPSVPSRRSDLHISQIVNAKIGSGAGISRVSFSPDGRLIAYSLGGEEGSHIWIKQVVGGEPKKITDGKWRDYGPVWSPDGQQLALISDRGGTSGVWTVSYLGGIPAMLKQEHLDGSSVLTRWSNNGQTIFYESRSNLYALNAISGDITQLTDFDPQQSQARDFRVSPDEAQVAYTDSIEGRRRILVKPIRGGEARQVTQGAGHEVSPSWLPDTLRFAFISNRTGSYQVYLGGLDGRDTVQITSGSDNCESLAVSPDGSRIISISRRENANIFSCDAHTGTETRLTSDFGLQLYPAVSPDSKRIAFQATNANITLHESIIIKPSVADGEALQLVSPGFDAKWSPDNETLAFLRFSDDKADLWLVSSSGRYEKRLTSDGAIVGGQTGVPYNRMATNYNWSPDGAKIAYISKKSGQRNLWLVSSDGSSDVMISNNADQYVKVTSPFWSPRGNRIAYVVEPMTDTGSTKKSVCVFGPEGTKTVLEEEAPIRLIGWSASGDEIFVVVGELKSPTTPQQVSILKIPALKAASEVVARVPDAYLHNIMLSRDGKKIVLVSRQDGKDNINVIPTDGGPLQKITNNSDPTVYYSGLTWAPDGETLFYSRQTSWFLILMMEDFH
jgi:serine/threonine protein kinase